MSTIPDPKDTDMPDSAETVKCQRPHNQVLWFSVVLWPSVGLSVPLSCRDIPIVKVLFNFLSWV
jgi:hypothetical protein